MVNYYDNILKFLSLNKNSNKKISSFLSKNIVIFMILGVIISYIFFTILSMLFRTPFIIAVGLLLGYLMNKIYESSKKR